MAKKRKKTKGPGATKILVQRIVMLTVFLFGLSIMLYPFVSQGINDYLDQLTVQRYQREANKKNEAEIQKLQQQMEEQNEKARKEKNPGSGGEPFSEERSQNEPPIEATPSYIEEHTAGTIIIPKIDIRLPVFDRTNDFLLSKGATILEGTSSLIGGESSHSVISSHRGLSDAKLFTDIPKLEEKDLFYIEVFGETHAYEVDQIKVIEPTVTEDLLVVDGMDYVTLLTCTPYGVNSHRHLVRGHRVPFVEEMKEEIEKVAKNKQRNFILLIVCIVIGIILLIDVVRRIFRSSIISRRKYELILDLQDTNGKPLTDVSLILYGRKGKRPFLINGKKVTATSDENGRVEFPPLYGKKYMISLSGNKKLLARTKVKRIKDSSFVLKRKSKGSIVQKQKVQMPREWLSHKSR